MKNYHYTKNANGKFVVNEVQTGHVVRQGLTKNEAAVWTRHLNSGGGFDGYTPNFFQNTVKIFGDYA